MCIQDRWNELMNVSTYSGNVVNGLRRSGSASAAFKRRKLARQVRAIQQKRGELGGQKKGVLTTVRKERETRLD